MIQNELGVSGTYLLCKGNRIHKFRIKWCSKSKPTVAQRHEVMRITEDIITSNNLPQRITTGQLKITTKISLWSPRSKALSLRQFKSEKQGHLSAHKHSYVLRVSLEDSKEQEVGCEHLTTFASIHGEDGWENALQPFNPENKVVETVTSDTEFVQMDDMQLNTKDTGDMMSEDKPKCQNQAHTKESVEVILDRYEEEQHFTRTSETEDIVSRIEKLVERACMAAKAYQNQVKIVDHDSEQRGKETAMDGMKMEVLDCSGTTGTSVELCHDLESKPKENLWKNSSFTITEAETVCQNETTFSHDRCIKYTSSPQKHAEPHLQVAAHWKLKNTKVSTNRNREKFNIRKAVIHRQCSACSVHVSTMPGDCKETNVAKPQACEIPLTVSSYSTLTHSTVTQNCISSDNMRLCGKITTDVAVRRKRRQKRNESDICEIPKKKRVLGGGISPVILGPTTFQELSPCHKGVMSVYNALKTFQNIVGRTDESNGIESDFTYLDEKLEKWLRYQSVISRLRAVPRVNSDSELREILRYIIRNLRNRSANLAFALQNKKLASFIPALWLDDTHSGPHTKRALIMRSEEKETEMQDVSKKSCHSTLSRNGADSYQTSSIDMKVGSIDTKNNPQLEAEATEKLRHRVKGSNNLFKCMATSENLPNDKDKYEVETNGVVQVLNFGDDSSGIVKPRCSPVEKVHGGAKRSLHVHYDEIFIPNVSYYKSPPISSTNLVNQKENIGHSSCPVVFKGDNGVGAAFDADHSLTELTPCRITDTSSEEIVLNAAIKLASLKELHTIPSIRALRTTLIQQGVDKAIEQTKVSSSVPPECSTSTCSYDFSGQNFDSSLNNTNDVSSKLRSGTRTPVPSNFTTLDKVQESFKRNMFCTSDTTESLSEMNSSLIEGSANNDCNKINCCKNSRPRSVHRKRTSKKVVPPHPIVSSIPHKGIVTAKPVRVNVGKLLSCSKVQVFFTTELYVDCASELSDCQLHNMRLKSQTSSNGEDDLITSLLHLMAFNASQNAFSTSNRQSSMANESLKHKISERNKLHKVSPNGCVNSSEMSQSHAYNFLKCTCFSVETIESISSTLSHCKCPPSIKFQGVFASYTAMSSLTKKNTPRRKLIEMIHKIKSKVKNRRDICDGQHCFYFHVDKEESVEGFYSTVEKYCLALSKFHSHKYNSARTINILLRDIWLPGHKHSISFYVNLPLQKCKCSYCGLDKPAELCLNCGELFERTELGNYIPFNTQKTSEHLDMKIEMSDGAVKVLNLVNDLYLCKPVIVIQETDISVYRQKKITARRRRKPKHICCNI